MKHTSEKQKAGKRKAETSAPLVVSAFSISAFRFFRAAQSNVPNS
jgi:hypothetical protein